jgi:hypothetical protein
MMIFDEPYVSDVLFQTAVRNQYPVLDNDFVRTLPDCGKLNLVSAEEFTDKFKESRKIYTNSENAISWINSYLDFSDIVERIDTFKNKVKFRDILSGMYPDFYYREVLLEEIEHLRVKELKFPFIIKPSVGFFSLGVYYVQDEEHWKTVREKLIAESVRIRNYYPEDVLDSGGFLIEEVIKGVEYAIDGYYDGDGNPVVLNVLKHFFAGLEDVSDRVYVTSAEIVQDIEPKIMKFLESLSRLTHVKDFPFHLEIRIDEHGTIVPIEMNPMRFAGWCCTDISHFGYGFNTYEYFLSGTNPDWGRIAAEKDKTYALCVIEKGAHIGDDINGFDYDRLVSKFSNVLALRKTDYKKYGVFAFMFLEVESEKDSELEFILNSDLKEFIL